MIEFNDRRVISSFLGMLVMGTSSYMTDNTNEANKEVCVLALRMLNHIAEDCSEQLLAQNAGEILTTIGNVFPEANDVLERIKSGKHNEEEPNSNNNDNALQNQNRNIPYWKTWVNWVCPVL